MLKFNPESWMPLMISLVLIALLGCNAKPFDYKPTGGEMKEGPGVFTGESGELTVYDSKKGGLFPKDADAKSADASGEKTAQTAEAEGTAAAAPAGSREKAAEFQEFQEFQQWQ
jgi:hypothetical protein